MTIHDAPDSIEDLIAKIRNLTSDLPVEGRQPGYNNYKTQKDHWLGWLGATPGTGSKKRKTPPNRGARYVYNHIVEPKMYLWLIGAAGVEPALVEAARQASLEARTLPGKSKAIRQLVPWSVVAEDALAPLRGHRVACARGHGIYGAFFGEARTPVPVSQYPVSPTSSPTRRNPSWTSTRSGANVTVSVHDPPIGSGADDTQVFVWTKPGNVETSEMGRGSSNVLVSVSSLVTAARSGTDPKSSDGGVTLKRGAGTVTGITARTLLPDVESVAMMEPWPAPTANT